MQRIGKEWESSKAAGDPRALLEQLLAKYPSGTSSLTESSTSSHHKAMKMTPIEMLTALRKTLQSDELNLRFDVLMLYVSCLKLLRRVQLLLHYCTCGRRLGAKACVAHLLGKLDGLPTIDDPQCSQAARVLRDLIEKEGSKVQDAAFRRTPFAAGTELAVVESEPSFESPAAGLIPIEDRVGYKYGFNVLDFGGVRTEVVFDGVL
jgi:hypothetical protein